MGGKREGRQASAINIRYYGVVGELSSEGVGGI